jgi:uncharacterized small protein (DUF1192 family)
MRHQRRAPSVTQMQALITRLQADNSRLRAQLETPPHRRRTVARECSVTCAAGDMPRLNYVREIERLKAQLAELQATTAARAVHSLEGHQPPRFRSGHRMALGAARVYRHQTREQAVSFAGNRASTRG